MKERPILFNGEMVKAILDGRKTQTRRVVKPQPGAVEGCYFRPDGLFIWTICKGVGASLPFHCPYGQPGDRLWVKERWRCFGGREYEYQQERSCIRYRSDAQQTPPDYGISDEWRPSIYMPRWASRITLEIVSIRVERVQDIGEEDSAAEGIEPPRCPKCCYTRWDAQFHMDHRLCGEREPESAVPVYAKLWDSINGKTHPWSSNPWVWVIEFKQIEPKTAAKTTKAEN